MAERKRGALQSPADAAKDGDTIVQHVQNIDASGNAIGAALDAFAYEDITIADSAIVGTALTYDDAIRSEMTLETAQIRIRIDGSDPSPSIGHLIEVGDVIRCDSAAQVAAFRAIRTGSTSGVLRATYFH